MSRSSRPTRNRDIPLVSVIAISAAAIGVLLLFWQRGHLVVQSTAPHGVTYRTEGTAKATTVVFLSATGIKKQTGVVIPLTTAADNTIGRHYTLYGGQAATLTVTNETGDGSVTCVIEIDGIQSDRQVSNTPYGKAECHATIP